MSFLLSVLASIVGGFVLWSITESFGRRIDYHEPRRASVPSPGSQSVYIEQAVFVNIQPFYSTNVGRIFVGREDNEGYVGVVIAVILVIILLVAATAVVFVQILGPILVVSTWLTIAISIVATGLVVIGVVRGSRTGDWSLPVAALFLGLVCAGIGGLIWQISDPSNPPVGLEEAIGLLFVIDLGGEAWLGESVALFFRYPCELTFLALQAVATVPMLISIALTAYCEAQLAFALVDQHEGSLSIYPLAASPAAVLLSAVFLGLAASLGKCSPPQHDPQARATPTEQPAATLAGESQLEFRPSSTPTPDATSTLTMNASPVASPTPSQEYPWSPCPDSPDSQLHIGDRAYVSHQPSDSNRVRDIPSIDSGSILGYIHPGEEVQILDGPSCSDQLVWWRVTSTQKTLTGWTAEGNFDDYWLIPLP